MIHDQIFKFPILIRQLYSEYRVASIEHQSAARGTYLWGEIPQHQPAAGPAGAVSTPDLTQRVLPGHNCSCERRAHLHTSSHVRVSRPWARPSELPPQVEEGLLLVRPGGGREGAALLRGPWGTFHSSWDKEDCPWEMGPGDQVDFMSDSLPSRGERGWGHGGQRMSDGQRWDVSVDVVDVGVHGGAAGDAARGHVGVILGVDVLKALPRHTWAELYTRDKMKRLIKDFKSNSRLFSPSHDFPTL
ncbi:hypothetical protein EYF80_018836 [Liparis tanakae]|uniref:Uncharacterized protein n=1 Tax=Liparis tanakae TaxID=230148 RepID=A0A4Z2HZP4_9TELE|nr:hypothetical protein EYF80_018836 [Liparis tanakae]